jgi:uncharacterized protein with ParB-like and HNH nuclease domain
MQAGDVKLGKVFANDHVNVIPLFQRPYVWDEKDNWAPLWEEMKYSAEEVAEDRLNDFQSAHKPLYFLGAVVLQQRTKDPRRLESSYIIDGQQRLTTLQVAIAALRAIATASGMDKIASKCTALLENREETLDDDFPEDRHKVRPLPQDKDAFLWAVMSDTGERPPPDASHRLVRARMWFEKKIKEWVSEEGASEYRLDDLIYAIQDRMQLVQINLGPTDHPQVIFEALNHRGVKLAASDLVKNKLFYELDRQGEKNAEQLLLEYWLELDGPYWREVSGRGKRPRVDQLIGYWLTAQSLEEAPVESLFAAFSRWMDGQEMTASEIIMSLRKYADTLRRLQGMSASSATGRLVKGMEATNMTVAYPLLLALHTNLEIPLAQKEIAADAIDSYMTRRAAMKLTWKDYNNLFMQALKGMAAADPNRAGDAIVDCLARQTVESRYWPSDDDFKKALLAPVVYGSVSNTKLKTMLIFIENRLRSTGLTVGAGELEDGKDLNIEHVLPQSWELNWGLDPDATEEEVQARLDTINSLGNLTLANKKLNSTLSNKAWEEKKSLLREHSLLHLTTQSVLSCPPKVTWEEGEWDENWDEKRIKARGEWLASIALAIWKRPAHAKNCVPDTQKSQRAYYETTLLDLIQAGALKGGTTLHSTSAKWPATARLLKDGKIEYQGRVFTSPSKAGHYARPGIAGSPNGWDFWGVPQNDGSVKPLSEYRAEFDSKKQ